MARGWQRAEGGLMLAAALVLFLLLDGQATLGFWPALALFFVPDLSFAAYAAGPRPGAAVYNLVHLYAFGAVAAVAGVLTASPWLVAAGLLWLGHSGMDRLLGYGLKLPSGFQDTHLGRIGRQGP